MAITYTSGVTNSAASGSAPTTGVHGITINSGDFVAVYINSNSTTSITHGGSEGTAFTSQIDETPSGKTCRQALFTKTAGASEPTSYTFASGDAQWQCIIKVFSSDDALTVDAAANSHIQGGNETLLACGAVNGETISDNALSIVAGGKDNRSTGNESYTTADQSYVSPVGSSGDQIAAMAHRIFTTGETFSGNVDIGVADGNDDKNDNTFSVHISLVEDSGGASIAPLAMHHYTKNLG